MTLVLVHGVPETSEVWDDLRDRLDRPSVAVALPGFGSTLPPDFAGKEAWERWLLEQLDDVPGPIDIVGHDWGSLLVLRIATAHGHRVRSWAVDVAAVSHPDYSWHDFAQLWQTPGTGEDWMRSTLGTAPDDPDGFFAQLTAFGLSNGQSAAMAASFDESMAASVLALYRSAVPNVHSDWSWWDMGVTAAPGLVLRPTADPFDDEKLARSAADRLGARIGELPGLGHFWMLEGPDLAAKVLRTWLQGHETGPGR